MGEGEGLKFLGRKMGFMKGRGNYSPPRIAQIGYMLV